MVNRSGWLARRAVLALALMVGFYVLGIAIAAGLLWIPYAEATYANRIDPRIALACVVAAGTILWALVPRPDKFEAPGPRLDESNAPGLFALVRDVASRTSQDMPAEAYLLNDANAFVTHRGGFMGFGSRRVLGVGLPLLQAMSVSEVKAVIAHEFGHYAAGDVALGPWIYKTRGAIGRTLEGLKDSWIAGPFRGYASLFLKLTQAISREQEFRADALAARLAGAKPLAAGLLRAEALPSAYGAYLEQEVVPVLRAGLLPPIASGFGQFLQSEAVRTAADRQAGRALAQDHAGAFDSHPSLKARIDALAQVSGTDTPAEDEAAGASLLREPDDLGRQLAAHVFGEAEISRLKPVDWPGVADLVYLKTWQSTVDTEASWLCRFTAETIPDGPEALLEAVPAWVDDDGVDAGEEARLRRGHVALSYAIGVLLHDAGYELDTAPGHGVTLTKDDVRLDPIEAVGAVITGAVALAEWAAFCRRSGLAGAPLAKCPDATAVDAKPTGAAKASPKAFPELHRPKSDPLYHLDQLGAHPDRWATAPLEELARLYAFHASSLVHRHFSDVSAIPLRQLHDVFERRASVEERTRLFQQVASLAEDLSRSPDTRDAGLALFRFLYDPHLLAASTAALNMAAVYAPEEDDPMSGVRLIAGLASQGLNHKRRAAWLAGLVALGDARVVDVVDGCWRTLSPAGHGVLARHGIGVQPSSAMVEFFLRWAEAMVGDEQGEPSLGAAFAGLINLANKAALAGDSGSERGVVEIDRGFPAWTRPFDSVITIRERWTRDAFGRVIEPRLAAIAIRELEPRVTDQVMRAWGI